MWVGYPNATTSMANGFGGTLAAPIWHDYMQQASNGYCGDFTAPTVPWHGTAFFGNFASHRQRQAARQRDGRRNGTGAPTNPYNNPSLYQTTPQPATTTPTTPTTGNGNGNGNGERQRERWREQASGRLRRRPQHRRRRDQEALTGHVGRFAVPSAHCW